MLANNIAIFVKFDHGFVWVNSIVSVHLWFIYFLQYNNITCHTLCIFTMGYAYVRTIQCRSTTQGLYTFYGQRSWQNVTETNKNVWPHIWMLSHMHGSIRTANGNMSHLSHTAHYSFPSISAKTHTLHTEQKVNSYHVCVEKLARRI